MKQQDFIVVSISSFIAISPIIFLCVFIYLLMNNYTIFILLTREDGLVENLQAIAFGASAIFSFIIAWKLKNKKLTFWALGYGLLGIMLVWVTGEEISWGQRILSIATPEWYTPVNAQQEINLHNIRGVMGIISWLIDHTIFNLIIISFLGYFLKEKIPENYHPSLWLPSPILIPFWICHYLRRGFEIIYIEIDPSVTKNAFSRMQEPVELILAFSIVTFLIIVLKSDKLSLKTA